MRPVMQPTKRIRALAVLMLSFVMPGAVAAQDLSSLEGFDPSLLMGEVQGMLSRSPDGDVDRLFQALHGAMQQPEDANAICALFDQDADRGIEGLNAAATRLGEGSRQRLADAVAGMVVAGLQGQPQNWSADQAAQVLKANGARAAIMHDGFTDGFADNAPQQARCRSLGQMLDVLAQRPQGERVLVTRLLLDQGLRQISIK